MLASTLVGHAQFTWSSSAVTGNLGTAGNWVGGVAPTSPANLSFGSWSAGKPELNLTSAFTATSLTFNSQSSDYSLGSSNSSVLSLGAGGITVANSSITFASTLGLTLLAQQSWALDYALSVSGAISGAAGINKTGYGDLTLSGTNTFTGGLIMDGGNLYLGSSSTAVVNGAGVVTSVTNGPVGTGTLAFNQDYSLEISGHTTLHNAITLGGNVTLTLELGYDNLTLAGVITGTGSAHIHKNYGSGTLTLSGLNTFPGGLDYQTDGTLILGSSSTGTLDNGVVTSVTNGPVGTGSLNFYSGTNTLGVANANTTLHNAIQLGNETATTIDSGAGSLTLAGIISGGNFTKIGAGTLTLSGANTFYHTNTVSAGTLLLGSNGVVANTEGWQIISGPIGTGLLYLDSGTTLAPVTGAGTITSYNPVVLNGDATIGQVGSTDQLRFDTKPGLDSGLRASSSATNLTVAGGILTLASSPNPNYYYNYDYNLENITVNNGAAVIFAFADALPNTAVTVATGGYVGVANGVLNSNPVGFLSTASDLVAKVSPSGFAGTFGFDSENTASPGTYTGTLDFSAFSNSKFAGLGTLTAANLGTGATLFAPNTGANAGNLAFSGLNGGTLQIDTALLSAHNFTRVTIGRDDGRGDTGKVALSNGSNNYAGGTTLMSGTLIVRDSAALGAGNLTAANAATVPTSSADAPKLTTTLPGGAAVTLSLPNALVVNTSYASSTYGLGIGGTDSFTLAGVISGSGIIDKYGTGTVSVTGNNSFTGKINILGGTLSIGSGGTTGSLGVNITNNATLAFNRSDALTYAHVVSGAGSLVQQGSGTLTLTGANTYSGGTTVNSGGTVSVGSGGTNGSITGNVANAGTLKFNRSDSQTFAGNIFGTGGFEKLGAGTLSVTGTNTSSGGTTVSAGALSIGAGGTSGSITGAVVNNATLAFNRSDAVTFAGNISGTGNLSQLGNGTLTLSGANTYSGGTTINAGTILIGSNAALGNTSGGLTFGGGTLKLSTGVSSARAITLNPGGGTINTDAFQVTLSGVISGTGSFTHQGSGILTLSGANTYSGGTTILGGGVLDFTANNNLGASAGAVTLNGGFLRTQAAIGNFTHDIFLGAVGGNFNTNGFNSTISGQITGSGNLTVQSQSGNGQLTLTNAGNNYTGATFLDSGILEIGVNNALPVTTAVTLSASAILDVDFNQTIASLASASATTGVELDSGKTLTVSGSTNTTFAGTISGAGTLAKGGSSTLSLTRANTYTGGTTVNRGTLFLGVSNALATTGNVTINATTPATTATLEVGTGFSQTVGTLTFGGSDAIVNGYNGVTLDAGSTLTLGGTVTYLANNNPGAAYLNNVGGGTLALGGNRIFDIGDSTQTISELNIYVPLTGAGFSLTKTGAGRLFLATANTYSGGTIINSGELFTGANNALFPTGAVTINTTTSGQDATLIIGDAPDGNGNYNGTANGYNQTIGSLTFGGSGANNNASNKLWLNGPQTTLTLGGDVTYIATNNPLLAGIYGPGTLNLGANRIFNIGDSSSAPTAELVITSAIAGTGFSLTKTGAGWLSLQGNNTYTGGTTISAGTLELYNSTLLGNVVNNASLVVYNSMDRTYSGNISGSGSVVKGANTGILTLTGNNTFTGGLTLNGPVSVTSDTNLGAASGSLTLNNESLITNTTMTLASTRSVVLGAGSIWGGFSPIFGTTLTYDGVISGSGGLYKWNSGTLTLTGASTYTGDTTIGYGTLQIGANGTTGSILGNIVDHATLAFARSDNVTFANIISGTGRLVQAGSGALTLTGANTYAGTTVVSSGLLRVGTVNALPTTTELTIDSGATLEVLSNQTIAGFFTSGGSSSSLQISSGTTFTVAMPVPSTSTTFAGSVTGAGIFAVSGAGGDVVNLTGSVTNTGGTSIGVGATLVIGTGGSISGPIVTTGTLTLGNSGNQTLTNVISGSGGLTATAGTTTLNGANLYTGPTNVNGGKLFVTNLSGSGTGTGTVTVGSGGTFGGTGTITGPLVLNSGGIVSPGASPGTLNVGATTFAGNAHFAFEINNATGTAGTHWDLLSVSGALTISANSGNPFIIDVKSLDSGNVVGLTPNFSSSGTYAWPFLSASGGITGFAANAFTIDRSQFQNSIGIGSFYVSQSGNNLSLNFIPIPEPSTYALLAVGLGVIVTLARRRRS